MMPPPPLLPELLGRRACSFNSKWEVVSSGGGGSGGASEKMTFHYAAFSFMCLIIKIKKMCSENVRQPCDKACLKGGRDVREGRREERREGR